MICVLTGLRMVASVLFAGVDNVSVDMKLPRA